MSEDARERRTLSRWRAPFPSIVSKPASAVTGPQTTLHVPTRAEWWAERADAVRRASRP